MSDNYRKLTGYCENCGIIYINTQLHSCPKCNRELFFHVVFADEVAIDVPRKRANALMDSMEKEMDW